MVRFASGSGAGQVTLNIVSTNDKASIALSYTGPHGGTASDSFTFALTNDTTVVAWIDAGPIQPDLTQIDPADSVFSDLTDPITCGVRLLSTWPSSGRAGIGRTNNGLVEAERIFADHFLNSRSGNHAPPANPNDPTYVNKQDYRMYQRLQASYELFNATIIPGTVKYLQQLPSNGVTPEPCSGLQLTSQAVEENALNKESGITSDGLLVYQVTEARLGADGQAVNQFLNGVAGGDYRTSTPWIWSVIQFDANGKTRDWTQGSNLQTFPSYQIYTNGFAKQLISEGDLMNFISLNSTSQYTGPRK
jgi:hypothetical protein